MGCKARWKITDVLLGSWRSFSQPQTYVLTSRLRICNYIGQHSVIEAWHRDILLHFLRKITTMERVMPMRHCAPVESSCILRHFDLILVTYCSIAQIWLHYLHWVPQICKKQNIRCYLSLHLQPPRSYSAQIKCDHEDELKMLFWGGRVWNKVIWNQRDYALIEHNFTAEHR